MNSFALQDSVSALTQFFSSAEGRQVFLIMVAVAIVSFLLSATLFRRIFILRVLLRLVGVTASLVVLLDAALAGYQLVQAFQ